VSRTSPKSTGRTRRALPHGAHRVLFRNREVITLGLRRRRLGDLYHLSMTVSWTRLFATLAAVFVAFNLMFALLYRLSPGCIANENPVGYWGDFFFSAETLATVGYGDMHPQTLYGHVVAIVEIFIGIMSLALVTGLMFARFSRPRARFLFARLAVVQPIEGRTTLMLRAANARQNIVMEASAQLRVLRDRVTREGFRIRRIEDLALVRNQHPIFVLGWNLMHVIDESSPLYGESAESLAQARALLMLTLSGTDETTGQTLMARAEYPPQTLRWNHAFIDVLSADDDGQEYMDYTKFHDVRPLDPAA
jgi:inward rectifier potassium channel